MATTSSGFTPLLGSLLNKSFTMECTFGILVIPPTNKTSLNSLGEIPASFNAFVHGAFVLSKSEPTNSSNFARVKVIAKCFGPVASAVINGKLISVEVVLDNSIFAFSAASLKRCTANLSPLRSIPDSFLNTFCNSFITTVSKSSPPKNVSPFVALTSKTPPEISKMDTSNVPPPKSYTATMPSFLSTP